MQIKSDHSSSGSSKGIFFGIVALALVLIVVQLFQNRNKLDSSKSAVPDIELATQTSEFYNFSGIIKENLNQVYSDESVSLYLNENLGAPFLMYAYKAPITDRHRTDNFFVHVYLKTDSIIKKQRKINYLNFDFKPFQPIELEVDGQKYFVFKRILNDEHFEVENVKYFNTGRFSQAGGNRSQEIKDLTLEEIDPVTVKSDLKQLKIQISEKSYQKIQEKRENAISNNVLLTSDEDLVNGHVVFQNSDRKKVKVRLKGDWTDHLNHPTKWSYRIIMEDEETVAGMRKFSVQHPKSRNYVWEWLFNKVVKENDLIGLRYNFIETELELTQKREITRTIPMGIMAMEESFDKILIENNRRREGVILAFDESVMWNEREQHFKLKLNEDGSNGEFVDTKILPIKVFNEGKVLADPNLAKQFEIAKDLLQSLREEKVKISEVFDLDKLTTYMALVNLFGGEHGLADHNMRAYYNPITSKLEPISFDSYSGRPLEEILKYPFSNGDPAYTEMMMQKLQWVSDAAFVQNLAETYLPQLEEVYANLNTEYNLDMNLTVLDHNSNFIKKRINPANLIVANIMGHSEETISVRVQNIADYPVVVENLLHKDGKKLNNPEDFSPIPPGEAKMIEFQLKDAFVNAFVSKKNKVGEFRFPKDVEKLRLAHHILGIEYTRIENIAPYGNVLDNGSSLASYQNLFESNAELFSFVEIDNENKKITFREGKYDLNKNLVLPKGYSVTIPSGFELNLKNNASFISFSAINTEGTKEKPVLFISTEGNGGGLFINGAEEKSVIEFTNFVNLSNPVSEIWGLSGAVNFHETEVEIKNSIFEKNRCEDALNIIRSNFIMSNTQFKSTFSDAFDGDFVTGEIISCEFVDSGNDGVDVSGSDLNLKNVKIINSSDKAISAGENSKITGDIIGIEGGEIGIVSKDLSRVILKNVTINNTRLGFSSFQKKSEYGKASIEISELILKNIQLDHLIENGCQLVIDDQIVETVSNNVIDQMYGKEYGKSSR